MLRTYRRETKELFLFVWFTIKKVAGMPRDFFYVMPALSGHLPIIILIENAALRHPERRRRDGSSYFFLKLASANASDIAIPTSGK